MGSEGKPDLAGQNILRLLAERQKKDPKFGVNQLARLAGLPKPSTVTEITKGRTRNPRIDTLAKIADAFGVDMKDLTLTKQEVAESERLIVAFEKDPEGAKRLSPAYSDRDAERLRARRAYVVRQRPTMKTIRSLVRHLRADAGEPDYIE